MEINQVQASSAYTASLQAVQPANNIPLEDQNREASLAQLDQETTRTVQEAFQVSITQEAREQLAQDQATQGEDGAAIQAQSDVQADQAQETQNVLTALEPPQPPERNEPPGEATQIVNIVA